MRLRRDGSADLANLFSTVVSWVSMLRDEGLEPSEITDQIVGTYRDMEHFVMLGPTISNQTVALANAMVRQAVELWTRKTHERDQQRKRFPVNRRPAGFTR